MVRSWPEAPAHRFICDDSDAEKLLYVRGVLTLLKDTELFGDVLDKALQDLDVILKKSH